MKSRKPKVVRRPSATTASITDQRCDSRDKESIDPINVEWLNQQTSLDVIVQTVGPEVISTTQGMRLMIDWMIMRLESIESARKYLRKFNAKDLQDLQWHLATALNEFRGVIIRVPGEQLTPSRHKALRTKALSAIEKLRSSLVDLASNPSLTVLLIDDRYVWLHQSIFNETATTPEQDQALGRILGEVSAPGDIELLRNGWLHSKEVPRFLDLMEGLRLKVEQSQPSKVDRHSPRSAFLRSVWSGLRVHKVSAYRLRFTGLIDEAVFPDSWRGDADGRTRELDRLIADVRKMEKEQEKLFPRLFERAPCSAPRGAK